MSDGPGGGEEGEDAKLWAGYHLMILSEFSLKSE